MNWTRCLPRQGSQVVASFDCCFCKCSQAPAEMTEKGAGFTFAWKRKISLQKIRAPNLAEFLEVDLWVQREA